MKAGPEDLVVTLSGLAMPGPWARRGRCRPVATGVFFPSVGEGVEQARAICALCPVQAECLEYALAVPGLRGVWGGTSEKERRQLRVKCARSDDAPVPAGPTELERASDFRAEAGSLDTALEQLALHPGRWARVAHFAGEGSAHSTASLLRTGRRRRPPGHWQFEGRVADDGGSDLYAMLEAEDQAS